MIKHLTSSGKLYKKKNHFCILRNFSWFCACWLEYMVFVGHTIWFIVQVFFFFFFISNEAFCFKMFFWGTIIKDQTKSCWAIFYFRIFLNIIYSSDAVFYCFFDESKIPKQQYLLKKNNFSSYYNCLLSILINLMQLSQIKILIFQNNINNSPC